MKTAEFALIVAAARKEVEKALASRDRSAIEAFAPAFAVKDGRLFMSSGGSTVDLGNVIGPRGVDGTDGIDGKTIKGDKGESGLSIRGEKGDKGDPGAKGDKGDPGEDGQDGVGVANAYVSEAGYLIIELTTGRKITAGHVKGRDGKNGEASVIYGGGVGSSGGSGAGTDLAYDEATRILSSSTGAGATLPLFDDTLAGLVPASGGGTANFLRADGTWAAASGGVSDGDKGDIAVSGSGSVWTIDVGAVTLAKQADMATASVVYRKTAGAGAPEVQALATLKTDLGLTGTNLGDQTSIVGITGTKAQFNLAATDGDFLFVGDVTQYTDEAAQDAVGAMLDASLTYVDATPLLQRAALTGDITAAAGSNATTLATVNSNVGSFGSSTQVPVLTVNDKGLVTAVANTTIVAPTDFGINKAMSGLVIY